MDFTSLVLPCIVRCGDLHPVTSLCQHSRKPAHDTQHDDYSSSALRVQVLRIDLEWRTQGSLRVIVDEV